jgi:hypothetical protein
MKTTPKTTRPASRKPAASKAKSKRGNMTPAEIKPLVFAARKAFDRQSEAGLLDDDESFDAWRHRQCMAAVGKPGITACNHGDFQPLIAHFQTLAGDDAAAFRSLMKTGKPTDHAAPGDTHEARRIIAYQIAQALAAHLSNGGKIGIGYLIYITRQKTRRPDLQLGSDWQAGLAERCTAVQLAQIRNTVINRIAAADGVGCASIRNKSQRAGESD